MPDIGNIARKQRPGLTPVRAVIVQHLAGALGLGRTRLVAPAWIVLHTVGRVGDHQQRFYIAKQPPDHIGTGTVTTDQPVRPELPEITWNRDRGDRDIRNVILALDRTISAQRFGVLQQRVELFIRDPEQRQIKILSQQPRDLVAKHGFVPVAQLGQLVVGDPVGPPFSFIKVTQPNDRHIRQPQHRRGQHPAMSGDQLAIVGDHAGHGPAELGHAGRDLGHLIGAVDLGIAGIRAQPVNRPRLDLAWREDKVHEHVL